MKRVSPTLLFVLLWFSSTPASFSHTGSVVGKVTDQDTGEEIVGANVLVVGTTIGATTDLDGKFSVRNIPIGKQTIRVSFVGYAAKVITGVEIKTGESLTLNVTLVTETHATDEVVVTAERMLSTEAAILSERKKAATIGDAVSMEQIKRTPDATSGDALKRVTGLSVVDNKFVFIRGVPDRYNGTMLNGVSVTTTDTDVDKKSFSFDLVPANLLENTIVTKSSTPDLPGDFTGGLVQLNTLEFPNQQVVKLSFSTSYNTITTLQTIQKSQGSARDWMGMDNGSRELPQNLNSINGYDLGKTLPNNWAQRSERAPMNGSLNFGIGDAFAFGESQMGYIAALSYRNGFQRTENETDYFRTGSRIFQASGTRDQYSVLWGGLLDVNFKFSGLHKVSLKNSYNHTAEDKLSRLTGVDENEQLLKTQVTEWDERSLHVAKLSGEHVLPMLGDLDIRWQGSYISSFAKEPDRKTATYSKNVNFPESEPLFLGYNDRSWSRLRELTRSASIDFQYQIGEAKVKLGAHTEAKARTYDIRFFLAELDRITNPRDFLAQPIDSVFMAENFARGKLIMRGLDNPRDKYTAEQTLYAGFLMFDIPFTALDYRFRIVGGARFENSEQLVNTISPFETNKPFVARVNDVDILPSLNLTYLVTDDMNLRFAYSQSVNRPEFRELANFYFFDYSIYEGMYGNPLLRRAFSKNYDIRFEWFPAVGELLAVSYFNKQISGAIEQQLIISSNPERTWFNSPSGKNYGWEFEIRKSLDFLGGYFKNFSITGNYTRIFSAIRYPIFFLASEYGEREMQGQAPYMINVSLLFTEPTLGTTVNLLYNEFGQRLEAVADKREQDVLEEPRGVLDVSAAQPIMRGLEMKFTIRDWGAKLKKYVTREGNPYRTTFQGTTFSLQASLTF